MNLLLIDDLGELWHGESRRLRAAFDSPYSGGEFIEYAVKNLGFVAINVYGTSCQVRLRPGFATAKALLGFRQWLQRTRCERLVISKYEGGWRDELVRPAEADRRIEAMVQPDRPQVVDDFIAKPLAPAAMASRPALAELAESWPVIVENYDTDTLVRLLRSAFDDRFVIVRRSPDRQKLTFQEFGGRIYAQYEPWRTCAVGAPIQEQPDRVYGRWISRLYQEATAQSVQGEQAGPRLDAVDAIVRCPHRGRSRFRYKRAIFRLPSGSEGDLFFAGSFEDPSIDLRIVRP
jgi:hypothetical protein